MNTQDIVKAMQTGLLQQNRLLKLDTPLGEDVLLIPNRFDSRDTRSLQFYRTGTDSEPAALVHWPGRARFTARHCPRAPSMTEILRRSPIRREPDAERLAGFTRTTRDWIEVDGDD